ncbi:leucine-rich repeat flightless-interacting protein 1-like isoform X1 [Pangasianodon hypophthalmus]|uniref:leucine-rich repeat flightless-interacting protein 1-like isoform X1 n=1 Tax=Pangasianodon hypophthalmus TaxID=310915 RepID=UPI0023074C27|nr:leucine-rich repeat flightless-interacting protein 1-like isoform X1 [Pangasianodon hypophthalmus]XP_053089816.1 leucine-rich repeat flightless-interacting protein 1-like isoform X1 [Pangasianodon hypophthalmus]XP_053089817.1 leucine-rich repeat flightless-interacting protein 1-like isoform X1 [Pangasianodon hypophthalmus]
MSQVNTLKASVQHHVEELLETHRKCDEITSEYEQEREAHSIMKSQYELMRETVKQCDELLKECEQECKAHSILKSEYNQIQETLTHDEESLNNFQVSLAEAERKYEKAMNINAQLVNENSKLISDIDLLQGSMQQQEEELNEAYRKCGMMMMEYEQEREARSIMKSQYEAMKESVKWCEKLLNDFKQEQEAHSILKSQYEEMTETITHREESLKNLQVALAEAERKYKQAMESSAQLEKENTHLISDSDILQDCVHELEEKLFKIRRKHDKLAKDRQQAGKAYSILQSQYEETLKQRDELLKECECEREAHNILKTQYNQLKQTFTHNEESLKEEKYEPVMESSAQLESDLMSQVNTLQASVQQLEEELLETRRKCDEITTEREKEQEVHSFLNLQYQEMRETLKQCSELLKNHRIALGSEEPVDL